MPNRLKGIIDWQKLGQALLILLPILIGFFLSGNILLFNVGLVTISLFIAADRLNLNIYAITLHFLLIFVFFSLLFFSFSIPSVFVILCAMMAFGTIYCTQHGASLRTLANYTFIPTVYLACELHETATTTLASNIYLQFIFLMPIALLSIWILYLIPKFVSHPKRYLQSVKKTYLQFILKGADIGEQETAWIQPALAIFFGVMLAASLVMVFNISRGEWVIWSVASVITIELSSSMKKFYQRLSGALIGVPLGFIVALFVPKSEITYSLAALAIMLTLVAFKRYQVAFASRCFFVALAAYIASSTPTIAVERISNVILGGMIGVISIYLTRALFNYVTKGLK